MAIDAGKVVAMLELDTSNFNTGLGSAQNLLRTWDSETISLGDKLKNTASAMTALGTAASTAITLPLAAAGTMAVKTFTGFDDAMRQVRATMNASEEDTQKLTAAAKKMGAETRYTAADAANALNYLALAGYNADQAIEALPTVLNLAQAGALDLGFASDLVTDSMSALGMSMGELVGFSDQLAVTSQKSNTNVAQLGEAILTVGGTAKTMAGGTAELNAELGILADNGIKGAEGGTHLRNILIALQTPTTEGAKLLRTFTNGAFDAEGRFRSLDAIFQELNTSLAALTDEQKQNVLGAIFNKTDLAAAQALLAGCGERFAELTGYIENSSGAAQQMADTMEGGIGGSFRNLSSAVEALGIAFGESLAPTVQKATDFLTGVTRAFSSLPAGMRETIVELGALAAAAGPVLLVGSKLVRLLSMLPNALIGPVGGFMLGMTALSFIAKKLDTAAVRPGITVDELESYKLPDTIELGTVTAEFTAEVKNRGKSAYDLIVEIMNDGLPETEADYEKMAAGVNAVIDGAMQAIEENYNAKADTLKQLLDAGVIDEADYNDRVAALTANTEETKNALTGDAQAVTDYVQALIAANAPMTEAQLDYLQQLIDKLVETSTAAGVAADAAMSGYRLAYERVSGGQGLDGDIETGAQYIEANYGQKLRAAQEAQKQSQADLAAELDKYAPGTEEYDDAIARSAEDIEKWNAVYAALDEERRTMYAEMAQGAAEGIDDETLAKIERYNELLQLQAEYQKLNALDNAPQTEQEWVDYGLKQAELDARAAELGMESGNLITALQTMSEELKGTDITALKDVMGYLYANDESLDPAKIQTVQGLLSAYGELLDTAGALDGSIDTEGTVEKLNAARPPIEAAMGDVSGAAVQAADVHDEMVTAAENSADGYIQGWEGKAPQISSTIARIMSSVGGTTARVLAIRSPSRVMRPLGRYTAEGFALGIRDNETLVRAAAESMAGAAIPRTGGGAMGAARTAPTVTLNLNNAVIRSDEDARTLARTLGGYIAAMNYGV